MTEITEEQRAAWERLSNRPGAIDKPGATVEADAALIEPLLPPELTNPQPVLPTEPGYYLDNSGDVWRRSGPHWYLGSNFVGDDRARNFAPFTRLVPELPQIDRAALYREAVAVARLDMKSYGPVTSGEPESLWDETSDMPESVVRKVSKVYLDALVNGADQ